MSGAPAHTCPVWALGFGILLFRLAGSYLLLEAHLTAGDLCEDSCLPLPSFLIVCPSTLSIPSSLSSLHDPRDVLEGCTLSLSRVSRGCSHTASGRIRDAQVIGPHF